jgi:hypothetical protein
MDARRTLLLTALALAATATAAHAADDLAVGDQTYLATIHRPAAFPPLRPVEVGILDAGVDASNPDLDGRIAGARRFGGGDPLYPATPHGTATAGLIAAIDGNDQGIEGIAPNARLLVADVAARHDASAFDEGAIERGIRWAADRGARVINLSLAGPGPDESAEAAIDYAVARGVLVVAAAGNCFGGDFAACTPPGYTQSPAWLPHVLAVGATADGAGGPVPAPFSIPSARWVDLAAPGDLVTTLWPVRNNPYPDMPGCTVVGTTACYSTGGADSRPWGPSGTSYAAPMVSAAAAVLFGADPRLRPEQVSALLQQTARPLRADPLHQSGAGMLDIGAALARVEAGRIPPPDYHEPNEGLAAPAPLPPSGAVRATLDWKDDPSDGYRLSLRRGSVLVVRAARGLAGSASLAPLRGGAPVVTGRLGGALWLSAGAGGRYRLELTAAVGASGSYSVTVSR